MDTTKVVEEKKFTECASHQTTAGNILLFYCLIYFTLIHRIEINYLYFLYSPHPHQKAPSSSFLFRARPGRRRPCRAARDNLTVYKPQIPGTRPKRRPLALPLTPMPGIGAYGSDQGEAGVISSCWSSFRLAASLARTASTTAPGLILPPTSSASAGTAWPAWTAPASGSG